MMMDNNILLVDDEAGIRKVPGISLQDSGYTVHTAGSGAEALRLFKQIAAPIVLTDIKMPDMDGIELDNKKYLLEGWRMVEENVEKIKNLSLDLLNYGKYTDIQFSLCDPNQPVNEVVDLMQSRAEEHGIELKMELNPDLKPIHFNPEGIHHCLLNLVTNAIDACKEVENTDRIKKIVVKADPEEGWGVVYRVVDSGSGMPEDVQTKIFHNFFSTKGTAGTGIGLMMTQKIVDQHQGRIELTSQKDVGSTFLIRLPPKDFD